MGTELAKAYVQIIPSAQGIKGSLQNALDPEAKATGESSGGLLGSSLVGKIKTIIKMAGIGKVVKDTLMEGADLQQSMGGIETMFKDSYGKVKQYADEAYKTVGVSVNGYMEQVTSFSASLLQSLGGDTDKAADIANMAMVDMGDNANKFGTDMQSIQYAYQGFAKQNYTMLDNLKLGYGGTTEEMQRLLADAEKLTGVHYDISNLSDVYEAIHVVQEELGVTGTTALEASTTFTGSLGAMKASVSNLLGNIALGQDIMPTLQALGVTVQTFLFDNLFPMIGNILASLPTLLVGLGQVGIDMVTTILNSIYTQFPNVLTKGSELLMQFVNGIIQNLPRVISAALKAVTTFVQYVISQLPTVLQKGGEIILNLVRGIIQNLPNIVSAALQGVQRFIQTIGSNLPNILQQGIAIIGELASGLIKAIPDLVAQIPAIIRSIIGVFKGTDWLSVGTNIISGIASGLRNAGHQLWDAVKGVLGSFKDRVLEFFGIHSPSRWGIWVGQMIDEGIAKGLKNINPISDAIDEIQQVVSTPITARSVMGTSMNLGKTQVNAEESELLSLLRKLVMILGDKEIVINLNDREMARAMREMGVVFE